jgi:hypothetical protein
LQLLRGHVDPHRISLIEFVAQHCQCCGVIGNDFLDCLNLRPRRRLLNGGTDHVGCETDVGRLELKALHLRLSVQRFHLPTVAAEDVRNETHRQSRGVKVVVQRRVVRRGTGRGILSGGDVGPISLRSRRAAAAQISGQFLPFKIVVRGYGWIEVSLLRIDHFLCLP